MQNYGKIANTLTTLCKSFESFKWNEEIDKAFMEIKKTMTATLVLALPNFSQEFVIDIDASRNGIGAALMQQGHPITFISKSLSSKHKSLLAYDKEMFAILFTVKK